MHIWLAELEHNGKQRTYIFIDERGDRTPRQVRLSIWHELYGDLFIRPTIKLHRLRNASEHGLIDITGVQQLLPPCA